MNVYCKANMGQPPAIASFSSKLGISGQLVSGGERDISPSSSGGDNTHAHARSVNLPQYLRFAVRHLKIQYPIEILKLERKRRLCFVIALQVTSVVLAMDMDLSESRLEQSDEIKTVHDSSKGEIRDEGAFDDHIENGMEKSRESSKHRGKDRKKSRREEKDHGSKDRERSRTSDVSKGREKEVKDSEKDRISSGERRKEDKEEREKDRSKDKVRDKDYDRDKYKDKERERDKDRKDRGKDKDHERERETEKEHDRGRERERGKEDRDKDKEREKERDKAKDREREKERDKHRDREKEKDRDRDKLEREKGKGKSREKERETDRDKERSRDRERDKVNGRSRDEGHERVKDEKLKVDGGEDRDSIKQGKGIQHDEGNSTTIGHKQKTKGESDGSHPSTSVLEERILKPWTASAARMVDPDLGGMLQTGQQCPNLSDMHLLNPSCLVQTSRMKEERLKKNSEPVSEVLSWVSKSRKLEDKMNVEKEKALHLSKVFEEQDNIDQGESEDEDASQHTTKDLAGVKVLHGLDKVIEGGAVVLTLKDQNILADGDINEEVDMLENVEIGEQKQRDEAYKAAKKKTGIYEDKFSDEAGLQKRMLPQYDDPVKDEGVILDESGRFTGEAEKKLEEGVPTSNLIEDLNSSGKISSDYYTHEEMLQFKKPKKKKSLRKKEKLDLDALEAEAISAGLGVGDLGSRSNGKRQAAKEEQERTEAERKNNAYQSAYAKAEEASKALRQEQTLTVQFEKDENPVFGDEDDDLYKSLEKARKLALKKQNDGTTSGAQAFALRATTTASNQSGEHQNPTSGELQENKVVFTEMEEFVWGLQLDEDMQSGFHLEDPLSITLTSSND
ncbi:hypothetical protein HHK36_013283 [Tetracentron sinense]|uniref:Uncharacterized protein n=1 Tax=Tetracentron sinense TaxID=13715 RepID=A0A834Z7F5_TETSI|nr:hypothetical protein HHK36_013283 [Tetracentron sinense]